MRAENENNLREKQALLKKKEESQDKLQRANALMQSIGSEKDRWIETKGKLAMDKQSLLGDMIISTCFVNYLGPFEGSFRYRILQDSWQKLNERYQIKQTLDFSLKEILGNVERISEWTLGGLPSENVSFENMIIIDETIQEKKEFL